MKKYCIVADNGQRYGPLYDNFQGALDATAKGCTNSGYPQLGIYELLAIVEPVKPQVQVTYVREGEHQLELFST